MKRNENRKNRNWRNFVVLTLVCMLAATLVGCKTSTAVTPEPSTSEVVSEPVSEPVSEEVSEPASEEVSEEVVAEIETTNFVEAYEIQLHLLEYDQPKVVVWNHENNIQSILSDGLSYEVEENDTVLLYYPNPTKDIECVAEYVEFGGISSVTCPIYIKSTGTDMEIPITITYEDGTEGSITVYITKDWE